MDADITKSIFALPTPALEEFVGVLRQELRKRSAVSRTGSTENREDVPVFEGLLEKIYASYPGIAVQWLEDNTRICVLGSQTVSVKGVSIGKGELTPDQFDLEIRAILDKGKKRMSPGFKPVIVSRRAPRYRISREGDRETGRQCILFFDLVMVPLRPRKPSTEAPHDDVQNDPFGDS